MDDHEFPDAMRCTSHLPDNACCAGRCTLPDAHDGRCVCACGTEWGHGPPGWDAAAPIKMSDAAKEADRVMQTLSDKRIAEIATWVPGPKTDVIAPDWRDAVVLARHVEQLTISLRNMASECAYHVADAELLRAELELRKPL